MVSGRVDNVTQCENRVKITTFDLREYQELNSKINVLAYFLTLRKKNDVQYTEPLKRLCLPERWILKLRHSKKHMDFWLLSLYHTECIVYISRLEKSWQLRSVKYFKILTFITMKTKTWRFQLRSSGMKLPFPHF